MLAVICLLLSVPLLLNAQICRPSITTANDPAAPKRICSGQLIFQDTFNRLDKNVWMPEVTFDGGGNGEFQYYIADNENSYAKSGKLYIKPTLTSETIGEYNVSHGYVKLNDCTDHDNSANCERQAGGDIIINPIRSARLITRNSFTFKYGKVEFIAKNPTGDWLWPALWLLPVNFNTYGDWSGEIDVMESRGNRKYVNLMESTLHFGQLADGEKLKSEGFPQEDENGFNNGFHKYVLIWNKTAISFQVDNNKIDSIPVGDGFWQQTGFSGENPWASGDKSAPFDQDFYMLINLAAGGTSNYFPDNDGTDKPWSDDSNTAMKEFWERRSQWLPSWSNVERRSFIVDSVKVWAI